jgi:hypothetical protein
MFPTAARKVVAAISFTPGTVISRRAWGQVSASCAITRSTAATSPSRKSICRGPLSRVSRSSIGSFSSPSHARPALLVGHPDAVQRPRRRQLGQRPRVEAVGLRPRLADAGVAG